MTPASPPGLDAVQDVYAAAKGAARPLKDCAWNSVTDAFLSHRVVVVHPQGSADIGESRGSLSGRDTKVGGRAMKSLHMGTRYRVRICVIALALGMWLSSLGPASAEPSAECRGLAARFVNVAAELDLRELAGLVTCVSAEMEDRLSGTAPAPPSSPPEEAPPAPAPAQPMWPAPTGVREQWPPAAPWGGPWPSEGPGVR
jgi:hypothetical protein